MKIKKSVMLLLAALVVATSSAAFAQEREGRRGSRGRGRMSKDDSAPKVGEAAPTFNLKSLNGKHETDLAAFRGKRPVVLFFGSYT